MILTLFCNEVDVTNRIKSISKHAEFSEKTLIGNTPSSEYKIKLMNQDGYFDEEMLKYPFLVYLDGELHDTLFVYDSPEELFTDIDLTLYDSMIFTNIEYTTNTSTYPKTIKDQLDEMIEITGISIDYSLLDESVLNLEVNSYDTSIMIRSYLSWISEIGACNVLSQPNNTLKFIPLEVNAKHSIENDSHVYNFKTSNKFTFSRVYFDNGVKVVSSGDEAGNTIYLSEDNPYISDSNDDTSVSQTILDSIHTKLLGLTFTSVSGLKMRSIDTLKLGEIIHYKEYFDCIVLSYDIDFINGVLAHNIITLDGSVNNVSKEKAIIVAKDFEKKRIRVILDNYNQKITLLSEMTNENTSQISQLEITNEEIRNRVSSVENDLIEQTASLSVKMDSIQTNILTSGGNNLIVNSIGIFEDGWDGNVLVDTSTVVKNKNIYGYALSMPAESRKQIIQVPAGTYTLSFLYKKNVELANCSLVVNGTEFILSNTELTEIVHTFEVNAGSITIELNSDTDGSCTLINLTLNQGNQKMVWSLNKAESWTENVKMSASGLEITNAAADVLFSAKADIIGFKNRNTGEYVSVFTDTGMEVDEIVVRKKANIGGLLIQRINDQVIMNNVGGVD